ncbi:hypothetical protein [Planococcus faecalis]|uniref:Uncharacterized protein n=1 Tax=Planococcus faecalis TaxID=1598147 RepID=A0ABN4XLV8_9BACL|nr:hypothetical protein [Planococcus faecalis]AQU79746.1 hypothetical protein AJGP001_10925 [Planococcus faecalis]OHX52058.1 hypothetical protein BB777_14095 [Planococcus faecalis]
MEYVIYQHQLKKSNKGQLPDVVTVYVSTTSDIGWHFDYTTDVMKSYRFEEFEYEDMKFYAQLLGMQHKPILLE